MLPLRFLAGIVASLVLFAGCDPQKVSELEEGVSTEQDVRARFGAPETIWTESNGDRTFEYPRQPAGHANYMISIGRDGRMTSLRQVLHPNYFAKVTPGLTKDEVRRMPVIGPDRYELTINTKTAEALGLTIPQSILVRADRLVR